jgi:hypothetical protein
MAVAQILDENLKYISQKFIDGLKATATSIALGAGASPTSDSQIILQSGGAHTIEAPANEGFFVDPVRDVSSSSGLLEVRYDPPSSEFRIVSGSGDAMVHESGTVMLPNLPTSDPSSAGQVWNDSGTLKVSSG